MSAMLVFQAAAHAPVEAAEDEPLITVCDRSPTPILFGCRSALCGTCLVEIEEDTSGQFVSPEEQEILDVLAPGKPKARLACQLRARGRMTIRYIGSGQKT